MTSKKQPKKKFHLAALLNRIKTFLQSFYAKACSLLSRIYKKMALLTSKKQPKKKFLQVTRLRSIKTKILIFSLLATLIPSLSMGWYSYIQNRKFLSDKITQEIRNISSQASRELELWHKERVYDVRVFSSSYVVSENLEEIRRADAAKIENVVAVRLIGDYLKSVREKFIDYEELMLIDLQENVVATSADQISAVDMPENWLAMAREDRSIIGKIYWDETLNKGARVIAESIRSADDSLLGVMVAKLNFQSIGGILRKYAQGESRELYLINQEGVLLVSSRPISIEFLTTKLETKIAQSLFSREKDPLNYVSYRGNAVMGTLTKVPLLEWGVVAEKDRKIAYANIIRLRNLTRAMVAALLIGIGLSAYLLGLAIVRPVDRLTKSADKVAGGDLNVYVPVRNRSEIGYLTEIFNHMVGSLGQGRKKLATVNQTLRVKNKELEGLTTTDSLTGLYNRKHLMETLVSEIARSRRHKHSFVLLMLDIDHFKKYNDTHGHLAGDELLSRIAAVFMKSIRDCDYCARYGGEEFMFILPEIGLEHGVKAADRIRKLVSNEKFSRDTDRATVTVSVGVSTYPKDGEDPKSIIKTADDAMYQAKKRGRNQVFLAGRGR
ncbi:MAG: diguanylate cyclase [Deltaproteobacteria bacterium]|nr:diguanylate cyclase [Deltaproteobacteria bacterium]